MNTNFTYYIYILIAIIIGVFMVKRIASCLFRTVFTAVLIVALAVIYYYYFRT